jgi:hypothetical protein
MNNASCYSIWRFSLVPKKEKQNNLSFAEPKMGVGLLLFCFPASIGCYIIFNTHVPCYSNCSHFGVIPIREFPKLSGSFLLLRSSTGVEQWLWRL